MSKRGEGIHWDAEQLLDRLKNNPHVSLAKGERLRLEEGATPSAAAQALRTLAEASTSTPSAGPSRRRSPSGPKTKHAGSDDLGQIIQAVKNATVEVHATWFPDGPAQELVLWFEGARLMTLNRMISLLTNPGQAGKKKPATGKRKPGGGAPVGPYYAYKKQWKERMKDAQQLLQATYGRLPVFTHPVTIEVMRHAPRLADRDSLAFMFKIHIDMLRDTKSMKIIRDDNPNEVVDVIPYQKKVNPTEGKVGVGLRLVAQPGWEPPAIPDARKDWLRCAD